MAGKTKICKRKENRASLQSVLNRHFIPLKPKQVLQIRQHDITAPGILTSLRTETASGVSGVLIVELSLLGGVVFLMGVVSFSFSL